VKRSEGQACVESPITPQHEELDMDREQLGNRILEGAAGLHGGADGFDYKGKAPAGKGGGLVWSKGLATG